MISKTASIGLALFVGLGACAGRAEEFALSSITSSSPIVTSPRNVCVVGYIVGDEGLYLNSFSVEYAPASVAVLPQRRSDAVAMAKYRGKQVRLCGRMVADKACFRGDYVCAPHSRPVRLLRLQSIQMS
ncbi:hypothetical protein BH10PSE14_BH10PSE14_11680 [soil metagenome]